MKESSNDMILKDHNSNSSKIHKGYSIAKSKTSFGDCENIREINVPSNNNSKIISKSEEVKQFLDNLGLER